MKLDKEIIPDTETTEQLEMSIRALNEQLDMRIRALYAARIRAVLKAHTMREAAKAAEDQ